jgi:phosphoglycerate dehydrogenase-like enzyme
MTMFRCAVLDDYQNAAGRFGDWASLGDAVRMHAFGEHFDSVDRLVAELAPFDAVVLMRERTPFPAAVLERLPRLKLLITTGARNMLIDLDAAARLGVTVCATRGSNMQTVELAWALILALARNILAENAALRSGGPWQSQRIGMDLNGSRIGLLGLGKIGSRMAAIAKGFGMDVSAWSQNLTEAAAALHGVELAPSLDALMQESDFVSVHLVLGDRTRGLVGREQLRRMKPTAYLINTARAAIIDRGALIEALSEGWIAGAGIDVFETEPLPADDALRALPNLLATPHLGHVTQSSYSVYYHDIVEDLAAYLAGAPIRVLASPATSAALV